MIRRFTELLALCMVVGGIVTGASANGSGQIQEVTVQIAPQTILLGADQGGLVTVHVGVDFSLVDELPPAYFTLEGVEAVATFPDDCDGELVCKFPEDAVKDLFDPKSTGLVTMTLQGVTADGQPIVGADVVRVTARNNGSSNH